jgi:cardiolipin synthase
MEYLSHIKPFVIIIYYLFISLLTVSIILDNKKPEKVYAYIFLIFLFPVIGVLLYFLFGAHYQKKRLYTRYRNYKNNFLQDLINDKKIERQLITSIKNNIKLPRLLYNLDHALFTINNDVKLLFNGEEKFPVLIEELKKAKQKIYMEYYIFNSDEIGNTIIDILIEKAGEGVEVKLIYDAVGSSISGKAIRKLKKNNVKVHAYMPVFFSRVAYKANYRNHRKITIIDDTTAFMGGINVADNYINPNKRGLFWRDTHIMLKGEVVYDLQLIFISDWFFVCGEKLKPNKNPDLSNLRTHIPAAILASDSGNSDEIILNAFIGMISMAKKEILITTPYFIPTESILSILTIAARSGVEIKILLPEKPDLKTAYYAAYSYLINMLKTGVKVYFYTKGMMHTKTMVIDDDICTIGSANMDYRSFSLNAEVNTFIIDEAVTSQLKDAFEKDLQDAVEVSLEDLLKWPWYKKAISSFTRLIAPIL